MSLFSLTLFLEINKSYLNFYVGKNTEDDFKYIYKLNAPIQGFENNRISDFELFLKIIKENIYLVEKKVDYIFKDIVLILENFLHPKYTLINSIIPNTEINNI